MTREELIRECFVLTCFLENIYTGKKEEVQSLLSDLEKYTTEELQKYYVVNSEIKNIRVKRFMEEMKV